MTVETTDITSGPYPGNDLAGTFSYTFRIEDKTQIKVYETDGNGVETLLVVDTDYTVAGLGVDGGGTITRAAGALPTGYTWYMRSDYDSTQDTDFDSQGGFFPDIHEASFDKLTFLIQQLNDQLSRSFKLPDSYSGDASTELPTPVSLKFLRWNVDADALELVSGTTSAIAADVALTPAGDIGATNVQDAVAELDTEKANSSHSHTESDISDLDKYTQAATDALLLLKADLASPAFTGSPTAPTQTTGDNSTKLATTAYVDASGGGIVKQIKRNTPLTSTVSVSSTSFAAVSGLAAPAITMSDSANKIRVTAYISGGSPGTNAPVRLQVYRDGSPILQGDAAGSRGRTQGAFSQATSNEALLDSCTITFTDEPGDTSAHTYQVYAEVASGTGYINRTAFDADNTTYSRGVSTIEVMEVTE